MTTDSSKTSTRKTIILATGAWHPTHLYDPLKHALAAHKVDLIVPDLPTMGVEATGLTWEADVAALLAAAEPLFEQGREIAIMGHSYGGIPACVATRGNSVAERAAQGKKGGFNHFVLLCAFALPQRWVSLKGMLPGQEWLDWQEEVKRGDGRVSFSLLQPKVSDNADGLQSVIGTNHLPPACQRPLLQRSARRESRGDLCHTCAAVPRGSDYRRRLRCDRCSFLCDQNLHHL